MKKIDLGKYALVLAVIALCTSLLMVFGSSLGLWEPIVGFKASRQYNDLVGYMVVLVALVAVIYALSTKQSYIKAIISLILGIAILGPNLIGKITHTVKYPPIHDISTDTVTPPEFKQLTDDREGAINTLVYGGDDIAKQQVIAFPHIKSIQSPLSPTDAFTKAMHIAKSMGWTMVVENPVTLHYEGTAHTPYFNFADDIVIRVKARQTGSIIDIRSVSRIGRGDRGVNAQRISTFIEHFNQANNKA
ncbi:DUF1499 domain-containing protein [Psychromonas aquatilis]|uniref:DUF1499 domain-containing protein n=1 Tax=Psychromonas aquatilis TaxID=2005072 RepID=A0ABU9GMU6_9GAMM